ncbi:MAG: multicopper oxidase domain-containing protein [Candidatus Sulfotelmatobacter sp.]
MNAYLGLGDNEQALAWLEQPTRNASDDIHPVHLHRHSFELTRVAGQSKAGILKDVLMLGGYQEAEVDFVADNPGLTLFHCHQQLHMDFGTPK